jgi:hypothetical protein
MAKRDNGGDPIVVAIDSFTVGNLTVIRHNTYRESSPAVQADRRHSSALTAPPTSATGRTWT